MSDATTPTGDDPDVRQGTAIARTGMSAINGMLGPWRKPARSGTRYWSRDRSRCSQNGRSPGSSHVPPPNARTQPSCASRPARSNGGSLAEAAGRFAVRLGNRAGGHRPQRTGTGTRRPGGRHGLGARLRPRARAGPSGRQQGQGLLDRLRKLRTELVDCPTIKPWDLPQFVVGGDPPPAGQDRCSDVSRARRRRRQRPAVTRCGDPPAARRCPRTGGHGDRRAALLRRSRRGDELLRRR